MASNWCNSRCANIFCVLCSSHSPLRLQTAFAYKCVLLCLQALRAIADKLEGPQGSGMMTAAVHSSAIDFLMNRLPPHPKQLPGKGRAPTLDDKVWCRVSGWCYLLPFEMTGMVCEDDDSDGEQEGLTGMAASRFRFGRGALFSVRHANLSRGALWCKHLGYVEQATHA